MSMVVIQFKSKYLYRVRSVSKIKNLELVTHVLQSWDDDIFSGFKAVKINTIDISNPNAFTPDFYRIGVAV